MADLPTAPQVFIAQMLLSGEGDTLLAIQSLIGAVGMTMMKFHRPSAYFSPREEGAQGPRGPIYIYI